MDFRTVLGLLSGFFEPRGEPYAVIGGLAMAALGMPRTTLDVDIVAHQRVASELVRRLEELGYETLHHSPGYSNHLHPDPRLGRIDIVFVRGETADRLFGELETRPGFGDRPIPVPRPEHLAATKLFAIRNDPRRTAREMEDVRFLVEHAGADVDRVSAYLERYGLESLRDMLDERS